ncbi:MAG: PH domain-containing protein [Muribaculaceae bacterium]|nr:PH domain-containing protein [Muribaculaceae bacterium]
MDKVYKSKVAKWYVWFCISMTIAFIGSIYLCYQSTWILLIDVIFMGIALVMIYDMLLHTDYTIIGAKLHIRCGVLFRMDLPISKITEITHKSTILSSPALSAKRIGLRYGKRNWVYVSPKNQEEFISTLSTINPAIQVN